VEGFVYSQSNKLINRFKGAAMLAMTSTAMIGLPAAAQQYQQPYQQYQATPAIATTQMPSSSVADLVERVSPAVVNIKVLSDTGELTSEGQGSGFVISPQGEVVTNYHVIDGGETITVIFNNGNSFDAEIIGSDEETDVALLRIRSAQPFPHVSFYQGPPIRIGDWVIAIGNPYGIGQSTSLGIISAIGRERVESGSYVDYIQTDATINVGNSGGPLFNPQGQVIGVNSAIFSPTGGSVGIGFSIPQQTVVDVVEALRRDGRVRRGWLGVGLRTAEFSYGDTTPHNSGAIVNNVVPGSPGNLYGLQVDDIILQINGQPVANSVEATRVIGKFQPGQNVNFLIERAEQQASLSLQVGERPAKNMVEMSKDGGSGAMPAQPSPVPIGPPTHLGGSIDSGLSLVDIGSSFRRSFGMGHDQTGVYVEGVSPGSLASTSGVKSNMVILEADSSPITSVSGFNRMLDNARQAGASTVLLRVLQDNGSENYFSMPL
jgi:serine protease Do